MRRSAIVQQVGWNPHSPCELILQIFARLLCQRPRRRNGANVLRLAPTQHWPQSNASAAGRGERNTLQR